MRRFHAFLIPAILSASVLAFTPRAFAADDKEKDKKEKDDKEGKGDSSAHTPEINPAAATALVTLLAGGSALLLTPRRQRPTER
jgi:hypothetical protein